MIKNLIIAICFIWVGLVLGISFLEAPLKFTAPGIDLKLGLGIGRIVFGALNKIELILGITISLLMLLNYPKKIVVGFYGVAMVLLLLQSFWLLPVLDERAQLILTDQVLPHSLHHVYYIVIELLKVIMLLITGGLLLTAIDGISLKHS